MLKIFWPPNNYEVREDSWGSGRFGSPRTKASFDGTVIHYPHEGLDLIFEPGQAAIGPITGKGRWVWVYEKDSYSGLEVTDGSLIVKLLYILPAPQFRNKRAAVEAGKGIGIVQDISKKYKDMIPHIHLEARIHPSKTLPEMLKLYPKGIPINPEILL